MTPRRDPRSYSAGRRRTGTEPSSKVRVYERRDLPGIYMTMAWHQTPSGRPVEEKLPDGLTWERAMALADQVAANRRVEILSGRAAATEPSRTTLSELFRRYHASADAQRWGEKHRADHERSRDFWLGALGADRVVEELTLDAVERPAREARVRNDFSPRWERRKLANLRGAVRWGHAKARLYDRNPLIGLSLPEYTPDTDALLYSEEETRRLWTPDPRVDWRVTLAVNVAVDTGRRLTAILALRAEDVLVESERVVLRFRAELDKKKRPALRPVSLDTTALLVAALEEPQVRESGLLFPGGRIGYAETVRKPWSKEGAIDGLHQAEAVLGIRTVTGRAYHGLKRRHVTTAMEVSHGDAALVGDQTGNVSAELIRQVYRKASRRRLTGHVEAVRTAIGELAEEENPPSEAPESTRESTRASDGPEEEGPGC